MRIVIDRFEAEYALLQFGESGLIVPVPRDLLPPDAAEGDMLRVSFTLDRQSTEAQRDKIADLLRKLQEKNNDHDPAEPQAD